MHMHKRRELINKYKELWDKYKEENPDNRFIGDVLRYTCGYNAGHGDKIEQFPVLAIPVTELEHPTNASDWKNYQARDTLWNAMDVVAGRYDLAVFGTDCGQVPEAYKVFSKRGLIEFLVGFKVDYVFGCIRNDEDVEIAHVGIPLGALAFQASTRVGEAFAHMVNKYEGSLRIEDYQGWNVFESE